MYLYDNRQFKGINEIKENYNLISYQHIMRSCGTGTGIVNSVMASLNIKSEKIIADPSGKVIQLYKAECLQSIMDKVGVSFRNDNIPSGYITKREFANLFNIKVFTVNNMSTYFKDFNKYAELKNCVGKAMPHSRAFFVDDNKKEIISSSDNIGLLAVEGDATMKGYFREPELTAEIKDGQIIYTKDMGYIDKDGFVYILGRNDDIVNVGGLKVSPLDVEAAVLSYSEVADCICIGVPDEITGEALKLLIVPSDGFIMMDLQTILSEKLESYKNPKQIEIVDKVERTYNGKLNRKAYK